MGSPAEDYYISKYSTLMHLLVIDQDDDHIESLLKKGFPINARIKKTGAFDNFPTEVEHRLHLIAPAVVSRSRGKKIARPADLDKTATLLHLAIRHQSDRIVKLLLEYGADVNVAMEGGETALIIAVITKQLDVASQLIEKGANVDAETLWGKRALHYAARYGDLEACRLLLLHAADVDGGYVGKGGTRKRTTSAESLVAVESLGASEDGG